MSDKVTITLDANSNDDHVIYNVTCVPGMAGHDAEFQLVTEVKVKDSRPVHDESVIYSEKFRTGFDVKQFRIPRSKFKTYSYEGRKIEVNVVTRVKVDDGFFIDTKVTTEHQIEIGAKPKVNNDADKMVEPEDTFRFFENLKAIPPQSQLTTMIIIIFGGIFALVSLAVGIHDQYVPQDSMTWFFSHYNSDGEKQDPIAGGIVISAFSFAGIWFAVRYQLRKYMKFRFNLDGAPKQLEPDKTYRVSSLFSGKSRVPLQDITLRIVACNMEKGKYVRGSGSNRRTVSFAQPIRGVKLYEKTVSSIPAHVQIRNFFDDEISFKTMYEVLYPPAMATDSHGIDVYWEIQLLHPEFVDQEIDAPTSHFRYEYFLEG